MDMEFEVKILICLKLNPWIVTCINFALEKTLQIYVENLQESDNCSVIKYPETCLNVHFPSCSSLLLDILNININELRYKKKPTKTLSANMFISKGSMSQNVY